MNQGCWTGPWDFLEELAKGREMVQKLGDDCLNLLPIMRASLKSYLNCPIEKFTCPRQWGETFLKNVRVGV